MEKILRQVIQLAGFSLSYEIRTIPRDDSSGEDVQYVVDFSGPDVSLLLERNGQLLDALEYVLVRAARLPAEISGRVVFDCQDWRRIRAEELRLTAQMAAERVLATGIQLALAPMNARERRIVHLALKSHPGIRTLSEGSGADRRVVIFPASSADPR